jgi:hypothetical protein
MPHLLNPQWSDTNGVLASGTVEFYLGGTSTASNLAYPTYDDAVAGTNTLGTSTTLDSNGMKQIWFTDIAMKYIVKDSAGTTLLTVDDLYGAGAGQVMQIGSDDDISILILNDNDADALTIKEGSNNYLNISTLNDSEVITYGNTGTNPSHHFKIKDDNSTAFLVEQGTDDYMVFDTTNDAETISFGNATLNQSYNFLGSGTLDIAGTLTVDTINDSGSAMAISSASGAFSVDVTNGFGLTLDTDSGSIALQGDAAGDVTMFEGIASAASPYLYIYGYATAQYNMRIAVCDGTTDARAFFTGSVTSFEFDGDIRLTEGDDLVVGTSTGTKIGTATDQKLAFFNTTPIVQPTASSQALVTDSTPTTNLSSTTVASIASVANSNKTLINEIRTQLVNLGLIKGS